MPKPRKIATFTFDQRGWSELFKHVEKQITTKKLDEELLELNLTGSKVKSSTDLKFLYKIMNLFRNVRTILLKNMGLETLDFIANLLCSKFFTAKIVDISDNKISKENVSKFVDSMEGRSITQEVPPIWIITDFEELFTKNFACCNPYKFQGCICDTKRFVHLGRDASLFMTEKNPLPKTSPPKTSPPKTSPNIPPVPNYPPPGPEMAYIMAFDEAKQQFEFALKKERENMHTISVQDDEFVLVEYDYKFEFVDFTRIQLGQVPNINGEMLQLRDVKMVPDGEIIEAITLHYCVDKQCTTPCSYLCANGGEKIWFRANSFEDGWIAASFDLSEWKWFPLMKCSK